MASEKTRALRSEPKEPVVAHNSRAEGTFVRRGRRLENRNDHTISFDIPPKLSRRQKRVKKREFRQLMQQINGEG